MNLRYTHLIRTTVGAIVMMSLLAACEKGVFMKDTKITTPDFKLVTQNPGAAPEEKAKVEIDLKSFIVSDNGSVDNVPTWKASLNFVFKNVTLKKEKNITIEADAVMDKVKSGRVTKDGKSLSAETATQKTTDKVEAEPGIPVMTYRTKCEGVGCAKYYMIVALHYYDDHGNYVDMQYLVMGWYRESKQFKRALLPNDLSHVTVALLIKKMEEVVAKSALEPATASTGMTAPSGVETTPDLAAPPADAATTDADASAKLGETASTGVLAPTGDMTPNEDPVIAPSGATVPEKDVMDEGDLPTTPEFTGEEGE